jgi:hypothetical protein
MSSSAVAPQSGRKLTKNEKRRLRDKESKKAQPTTDSRDVFPTGISDVDLLSDVEIEYVSADYEKSSSILDEFKEMFQKVKISEKNKF